MANAIKILDDIIRTNPELAGVLKFVKGELQAGNISNEAAMRSANYAERTGRAKQSWKGLSKAAEGSMGDYARARRPTVEHMGDMNTAREAVRDVTSTPAFNRIDERMRDFDLKGNGAKIDHVFNKEADNFAKDGRSLERSERTEFDQVIDDVERRKREEALGGIAEGNDMGFRRAQAGLEDNKIETWYANARKSGLSHGDAVKEAARFESDFRGEQVDPTEINSYIAKYFPDLMDQ